MQVQRPPSREIKCDLDCNVYTGQNLRYWRIWSTNGDYLVMQKNTKITISKNIENIQVAFSNRRFDSLVDTKPKIIFKRCVNPANTTFSHFIDVVFPPNCNITVIRNND